MAPTKFGQLNANFWRDRRQQVLVRFGWAGWTYHYHAVVAGGGSVTDEMLDNFLACVEDIQVEWSADAPDLPPDVPMAPD